MRLQDIALTAGSAVTRNVPYFRGLGTLYRLFNGALINLGARPLVTAPMKDGTRLVVDLRTQTELDAYYRGEYDAELLDTLRALLDPDACFLDVGANVGFYALAIAAFLRERGGAGRVVAFEPVTGNYDRLIENVRANRLEERCAAHRVALSNRRGEAVITLREDFRRGARTGNAALPTSERHDAGYARLPIELERLDDLWPRSYGNEASIDVMKLDIEGHEDFCLAGARVTLAAHRPALLMEVNKPYYAARGVGLDETILPRLPERYAIFQRCDASWRRIESLAACRELDNVLVVPVERLGSPRYALLGRSGKRSRLERATHVKLGVERGG
jgi:FkbM family methyltransferase